MQILKVIFKFYTEKPIETAELQPEGAAGGTWLQVGCAIL